MHQSQSKRTFSALIALLLAISVTGGLWACNIPVFRYALERWQPDAVECVVFYRGGAVPPVAGLEGDGQANLKLQLVNLDRSPPEELVELWGQLQQSTQAALPHVVIRTRVGGKRFVNHWHGPLSRAKSFPLLESPLRSEIRNRLIAGHSVVWVLVRSKDEKKTDKTRELIRSTLPTLAAKIELPEGIGLPGSELYADVPLFLKFSVVELDPSDPDEAYLASLLTGTRQQAFDSGEPLAVPVFGRGRALEVIPGDSLTSELIEQLTIFLSGACSCQVKEQNPGFDLLIKANWDDRLFGGSDNRPPDRSEQEGQNRNPVLLTIPPGRK